MFRVEPYPEAAEQIAALPGLLCDAWREVVAALEVAPWGAGRSINDDYPDAPVRQVVFGPGGCAMVTYLILDRDREVHILKVQWAG